MNLRGMLAVIVLLLLLRPALGAEPVRIGVSLALTGEFSVMADMQMKGFLLWERHVNQRGGLTGRPVKVVIEDDRADVRTAQTIYRKLIVEDKVDFIFAPYSTKLTEAILPIAEKYRYPAIIAGAAGDSLWEKGYRYAVGVYTPSSRFVTGFFELLVQEGIDGIAIAQANDPFSSDLAENTKLWARRFGLKLIFSESFSKGTPDLEPLGKRVQASGARVLILCGHFEEAVNMRMALKRVGWFPKAYYASIGPALQAFHDRLGSDADLVFSTSLWEPESNFPGSGKFFDDFISSYRQMPGYHAALAYAGGEVLEAAVRETHSLDRDKVRDALFDLDAITIIGRYGIDRSGKQVRQQNFVVQWQKNVKKIVWPEKLRTATPVFR